MPKWLVDGWPFIQQFLAVGLGSGAALAITNIVLQHRRDRKARADAVMYLAIQLAFQLEGYVIRCANVLSDNATAGDSDGHAGAFIGKVPSFEPLPEGNAYQYLPPTVLGAILDLPQRRDMAQEFGMFYWNMLADEEATRGALAEHTIRMALAALEAADLLRNTYPIGFRNLTFGKWNIRNFLAEEMQAVLEREEEQRRLKEEEDKAATGA